MFLIGDSDVAGRDTTRDNRVGNSGRAFEAASSQTPGRKSHQESEARQVPMDLKAPSTSKAYTLWRIWSDGFWIFFSYAIAAAAFSVPCFVVLRLAHAAGGDALTRIIGIPFFILAGPLILSKVFRALDDPHQQGKRHAPQNEEF
jgi:hypothetical protein